MEYTVTAFTRAQYREYQAFSERYRPMLWEGVTEQRRRWWCFDNPVGGLFAVAHTADEIAATCYLAGKQLALGSDRNAIAFEIGETWTAEAHRRRGLFSRLVQHCGDYAFDNGASVVYGTPNSQSTPGYAKLGYKIEPSRSSNLFVIGNPLWFLQSKSTPHTEDELALEAASFQRPCDEEINLNDFVQATGQNSQLCTNLAELRIWRFGNRARPYRFFSKIVDRSKVIFAIRQGMLGSYPVLVIAEAAVNGGRAPLAQVVSAAKSIARRAYSSRAYAGIYVHSGAASDVASSMKLAAAFGRLHRNLPLCVLAHDTDVQNEIVARFESFQLSDCDIG